MKRQGSRKKSAQVSTIGADDPHVTANVSVDLAASGIAASLMQYLRRETGAVWNLSSLPSGTSFSIVGSDGSQLGFLCLVTEDETGRYQRMGTAVATSLPALVEAEARLVRERSNETGDAFQGPGIDAPDSRMIAYFQPIVSLQTGHVMAVEALARIQAADGVLGPDAFLHTYRSPRAILGVFDRMIDQALTFLADHRHMFPDLSASVNLELAAVPEHGFADLVANHLDRTGTAPGLLTIELNERLPYDATDRVREQLQAVAAMGVDLVLDDFPSSLRALQALQGVSIVGAKLDRSYVRQLTGGEHGVDQVRSILARARELGIEIIAEGVETQRQCDVLVGLGCRFGQGYAFAVPQPGSSIVGVLDAPLLATV
jgi:EAL domain-containing protein (putative c-di-GMP-specific phosphodiesterase class I)